MVKKTVLTNGIKIITEHMPQTYSATVMVWVDSGSNVETNEQNGISHLIEHMVFKGTKCRSAIDIVQSIECMGGSMNAFTDKEATCYYAKVLGSQVSSAIDTLLDMVFNSLHNPKDLELEKQVVIEEIRMYEDTPDDLVHELLLKSFWGEHPLGRPIAGTVESVENLTRSDIIDFTKTYYAPDNITISIAGNFDEDKAIEQITRSVEHICLQTTAKDEQEPFITPQSVFSKKDIEQSHLCLGTRGISVLDDRRYALSILDVCFGGGMASRLFQEIREKRGLVYTISTYEALYRPAGMFGVYAGTSPKNVEEVLKITLEEINKLKSDGLTDEEIDKAKEQLKGSMLIGMESTKYRASRNGRSELYLGRIVSTDEICKDIDLVTSDDIQKLATQIFDEKNFALSVVGPKRLTEKELALIS